MSMIPNFDITSANAVVMLTVEQLYPAGIQLQQFATDQSFSEEDSQVSETRMGVDGKMVAGYIPNIKVVTIMLEASSPSYAALCALFKAQEIARTIYACSLVARAPSLRKTIKWSTGVLYSGTVVPAAQQIFAPTTWVFHFQDREFSSF